MIHVHDFTFTPLVLEPSEEGRFEFQYTHGDRYDARIDVDGLAYYELRHHGNTEDIDMYGAVEAGQPYVTFENLREGRKVLAVANGEDRSVTVTVTLRRVAGLIQGNMLDDFLSWIRKRER